MTIMTNRNIPAFTISNNTFNKQPGMKIGKFRMFITGTNRKSLSDTLKQNLKNDGIINIKKEIDIHAVLRDYQVQTFFPVKITS